MSHVAGSQLKSASRIIATGNTFPKRSALAALGFKWDADNKQWSLTLTDKMKTMAGRQQLAGDLRRLGSDIETEVD